MRNVWTHYTDHDCVGLVKKKEEKKEDEKKIKKAQRETERETEKKKKKKKRKETTKCKCLIVSIGVHKTAFGD